MATSGQHDSLEAIEKASQDELQALQLERMQWSLQHAYENVPCYKKKFDEAVALNGNISEQYENFSKLITK